MMMEMDDVGWFRADIVQIFEGYGVQSDIFARNNTVFVSVGSAGGYARPTRKWHSE